MVRKLLFISPCDGDACQTSDASFTDQI